MPLEGKVNDWVVMSDLLLLRVSVAAERGSPYSLWAETIAVLRAESPEAR